MILINSGGLEYSKNTEKAFDKVVELNKMKMTFPILGPNIMVTKYNDIILNHNDIVNDSKYGNDIKIRNLTKGEIQELRITDNHYNKIIELPYMFLDKFMDKYFNEYDIFFDIKNRIDSGVSSSATAKVIIDFLIIALSFDFGTA